MEEECRVETKITELNHHTDPATKQMLQNLVERKLKFDHAKKAHLYFLWTGVFSAFFYMYYIYSALIKPYSYSVSTILSYFLSNSLHLFFLLAIVVLLGGAKVLFDRKQKTEKEYHALRGEIIDRSKDLWKEDAWRNRHHVFKMMKSEYDINLYHESK